MALKFDKLKIPNPLFINSSYMRILLLIFWGVYVVPSYSQNFKLVDDFKYELTYYEGFSKKINSLSSLPDAIVKNVNNYLKSSFGNLASTIYFSHGQIVDLKRYFIENPETHKREWQVPKYDLIFILKDSSIGIKSHGITLRVDQYGQILYCNWPREGYSDKNKFKSISEIEKFALNVASRKGYNINHYTISFNYNEKHQKVCWEFQCLKEGNSVNGLFNAFEIDWKYLEIIEEYEVKKQTVY
jgi:hypothetical protein